MDVSHVFKLCQWYQRRIYTLKTFLKIVLHETSAVSRVANSQDLVTALKTIPQQLHVKYLRNSSSSIFE